MFPGMKLGGDHEYYNMPNRVSQSNQYSNRDRTE